MPCSACPADIETHDGELVCESCVDRSHSRCDGCGCWYRTGSSCGNCSTCDRCETTVPQADTVETLGGSVICPSCRQDWYWRCESCDGWNRDGYDCANGCSNPDSGDERDCDCHECRDGELVHEYDFKPRPVFHGDGPVFFGLEIEVETPYPLGIEPAEIAQSHLGALGYLKTDSSIGCGFEIVTHPMSYPWAMSNFPWKMLIALADMGCLATSRTGIHVHISRAGFASPCHTYRWIKLIYRNQPQITALARRCCPQWAAFDDDGRQAVIDYAKGARGAYRYRAINACNRDTFELRVFASSLDPTEVQAALGLAAASVEYTRTLSVAAIVNQGGWTWPAFVSWLGEHPTYAPTRAAAQALTCAC